MALARSSHEYIWDMLRWHGRAAPPEATENQRARELFKRELFGIDEPLSRVVDYFKAAAAGSDVGRRLLLLLGPPSGGKSTLAILLKRGLEEYSRTDEGALYAIRGSPLRENPLNLIPTSLRAEFRERYGVHIQGELSPWARDFVEREFEGRLRARAGRAGVPQRGLARRHRHLCAARPDHRGHRRPGRLGGSGQGGADRR